MTKAESNAINEIISILDKGAHYAFASSKIWQDYSKDEQYPMENRMCYAQIHGEQNEVWLTFSLYIIPLLEALKDRDERLLSSRIEIIKNRYVNIYQNTQIMDEIEQ